MIPSLSKLFDVFQALLSLAWIFSLALALGSVLLRRVQVPLNILQQKVLSCGLGLGILAYSVFVLGLLGLLFKWLMLLMLLLTTAIVHRAIVSEWRDAWTRLRRLVLVERSNPWFWIFGGLGAVFTAYIALFALAPEVAFDAVCFYLEYAWENLKAGRILFHPNLRSTHQPYAPVQLYELAMAFAGSTGAKLVHFLFFALIVLWVYALCRPAGRKAAASGVLLLLAIPVMQWEASTAMLDLPYAFFSLCAISLLVMPRVTLSTAALAGLFFGLALSSKHLALFFGPPFLIYLLCKRDGSRWRERAMRTALFAGIAFVIVLPWYTKSYIETGNPVFPIFQSYFQSPYQNKRITEIQDRDFERYGIGRSWRNVARLPWELAIHPGKFQGSPGLLLSLLLPLLWWPWWRNRQSVAGPLAFFAYSFIALWFMTVQASRYLIPALPLFVVLAAQFLAPARRRWAPVFLGGIVFYSLFYLPPVHSRWSRQFELRLDVEAPVLQCVLGQLDKDSYIARYFPAIYVYRFINRELPSDAYILSADGAAYYCDRRFLYTVSPDGTFILDYPDLPAIYRRARELGLTHVVVDWRWIRGNAEAERVLDELRTRYLERVYSANDVDLYRIR